MGKKFIVHLSEAVNKAQLPKENGGQGLTIYRLSKLTGVAQNTWWKYAQGDIETPYLTAEVIQMCEYFGLNWHNPEVVEVISEEDESSGELKTVLAPA